MNLEDFNNKILIINDYAKNTLLKKMVQMIPKRGQLHSQGQNRKMEVR